MKAKTIVIIGGALAGPAAAARARELNENARIILFERNKRVSYALAGLAYHLSGEVKNIDELNTERADFFKSLYNIDILTETPVTGIDPDTKTITIQNSKYLTRSHVYHSQD